MHVERAQCELVVRGGEDDCGHGVDADGVDHLESRHPRHLDVQNDEVRLERAHRLHDLQPVLRLGHHLDVRATGEARADDAPRRRLVVGDDHARGHAVRHGSSMVSRRPPSSRFRSVSVWRSP